MKRFVTAGALVTAVLLTAAQPAAASWLQKSTPVPSGASMWSFSAVSCPSGLFCMAVGATESRLLAETRVHDTWTEVSIPDPGGGQLAGVSCTSTSSCEAVGQFTSGGTTQTLAEAWNGSTWSIQATPNPSGATGSQLNGVSCRSASSCAAVGQFTSGGTTQTLAEAWNGSTWKIRNTPNASGADTSQLNGVSCPAATACEAVGVSQTGSAFSSLAEVWNGSTWKTQATPNRGGSSPSQLDAVSCTAANACTATGTGLAERWNGHAWALQTIAKARGQLPELAGVSCTASTRCLAVGDYFPEAIETQVSEQWDGTRWTVVDTSITTSADSSGLDSISCSSSTACAAAGFYHNSITGNKALAENWALRWQLQPPEVPSGALASDLHTVSCPVATFCAAVGGDELNGGVFDAVVETWNGKFWTVGTTPNASNSNLSGVSCNGAKVCTAVGDVAKGGSLKTLAERWNGTSWTVQSTPNPAGAVHSFLISVSCPSTKACIAVGFFTVGSGNQTPFAAHWNGTKWTLTTTPHPSGSTTSQLNAVSCTSSTACEAVGSDNAKTWAEKWNGTSWKIQSTPTPAGGRNALLDGVSCTAANACTAVGDFVNGSNKVVPLAERWNGTTWTVQGAAVPSGSVSEFSSVSCSLVSRCVAVGSVTKSGVSLPLGEFWNGTTWAVDPAQSPDLNVTRSTMSSVSCGTSLTCMGVGFYDTSGGVDAPVASSSLNAQCWRADAQWASARRPGAQRWSASPAATRPR